MTASSLTYDLSLLERSLTKWKTSRALRTVYGDIFAEMRRHLASGNILEIGSGIGMARNYFPGLVTSDIVVTPFVDRAVSAYEIPPDGWNNIIAVDMLHHLLDPLRFLESAAAALAPGGRIILAEPAGTWWGRAFYGWFHHEPCQPCEVQPPFRFTAIADGSFANMGIASVLFDREQARIATVLQKSGLKIVCVRYRDILAYPATGGFSHSALLPVLLLRALLVMERTLPQFMMQFIALRMIIVLEKEIQA